ncbi:hypothetical protein D3C72_2026550 [compost metagenome]
MVFVKQFDGNSSAVFGSRLVTFLEVVGLGPFIVEVKVSFKGAALQRYIAEFAQTGLFGFIVFFTVAFAVFYHFGFEIKTAYFGKSHPEISTPFYLKMEFRNWVIAFSCHMHLYF